MHTTLTLTVVFEVDFTVAALNKTIPWEKPQETAFPKIRELVDKWSGQTGHCKEGYRYVVVLDLPDDKGTLGALLYWCEHGGFSHNVRWFTGELTVTQTWRGAASNPGFKLQFGFSMWNPMSRTVQKIACAPRVRTAGMGGTLIQPRDTAYEGCAVFVGVLHFVSNFEFEWTTVFWWKMSHGVVLRH